MDPSHDKPRVARSKRWPKVRAAYLATNRCCAACGATANLEVHHVRPVHAFPELELVDANFITLCDGPGKSCHLTFGHLCSWYSWNLTVREDAAAYLVRVVSRPRSFEPRGALHLDHLTKGLNPTERNVLLMRYADGLNRQEIARVLEIHERDVEGVHDDAVFKIRRQMRETAPRASMDHRNRIFTTGEVAKLLRCAQRTVAKMIDSGELVGYRLKVVGNQLGDRRVTAAALDHYCRQHEIQIEMPYGLPDDPTDPPPASAAAAA